MAKNRAVFVDRDNTLIASDGYLADPQAVRLLPFAAEAVARLRNGGYHVVVATNQSGVARGLITEEQLAAVHQRMQDMLQAAGTGVDAIYYCPFLDSDDAVVQKYRRDSDLRKPKPGMLLQAARDLDLDLNQCWMVGDAPRDIDAGRAAGCRTIRIGHVDGTSLELSAPDLRAAADLILSRRSDGSGRSAAEEKIVSGTEPKPERPTTDALLNQVVDELRTMRHEARHADFSMGKLLGSIAQAFAVCALGWGLYAAMEISEKNPGAVNDAVIRLLAAIVFQLMALTAFAAARRG